MLEAELLTISASDSSLLAARDRAIDKEAELVVLHDSIELPQRFRIRLRAGPVRPVPLQSPDVFIIASWFQRAKLVKKLFWHRQDLAESFVVVRPCRVAVRPPHR